MKKLAIGILAHVDAGKTTLCEALLYLSGAIRKRGRVDRGDAYLDTHTLEKARGITIFSKQAKFNYNNTEFTVVDTPGHVDFSAEAERALSVLDYAVLVVSGTDGVQSHTETLWKLLRRYSIPTFIFINKTDIMQRSRSELIEEIQRRLSERCIAFEPCEGTKTEYLKSEAFFENLALADDELFEKHSAKRIVDADIADWYEKQLKSDKELYASNPERYKDNEEYFEKYCGIYDDAAPALVVPEGYSRIMDIVVIPKGELGDDYKKKNEQLDSLREECTSLLFTDALNGDGANSERIAQLISDYKTLQAECDEMYNKFIEPYRAKIDKAFAELEDGADFAQVMLKYTENEYVAGSDSYGGCETFRTKGQLISTKHSSSKGDWSSTVKEIYSLLKPGEYSDVFTDTDGSLHIIYRGADETPGEVKLADVIDKVTAIVKATSDTEAWDELLDTWMDDADIVYDKDLIASVGKDYVKE